MTKLCGLQIVHSRLPVPTQLLLFLLLLLLLDEEVWCEQELSWEKKREAPKVVKLHSTTKEDRLEGGISLPNLYIPEIMWELHMSMIRNFSLLPSCSTSSSQLHFLSVTSWAGEGNALMQLIVVKKREAEWMGVLIL